MLNNKGLRHFLAAVRTSGSAIGSSCHLAVKRSGDCGGGLGSSGVDLCHQSCPSALLSLVGVELCRMQLTGLCEMDTIVPHRSSPIRRHSSPHRTTLEHRHTIQPTSILPTLEDRPNSPYTAGRHTSDHSGV